jgi:hypothetical protein
MDILIQLFKYRSRSPEKEHREREFVRCFQHNLSLPYVNKVHVFLENPADYSHFSAAAGGHVSKCVFIPFGRQPHYKDFLEYAKSLPDNTVFCVMNTDILLDEKNDFSLITKYVDGANCFALTRHEYTTPEHEVCNMQTCIYLQDYSGSHDMFILKTPLLPTIDMTAIDYRQNTGGGENILMRTLKNAGYSLKNPCYQIRGFHVHSPQYYFEGYNVIGNHHVHAEYPCILT